MQLDAAAISALAAELSPAAVQSSAVYVRLPIRFDSKEAEVGPLSSPARYACAQLRLRRIG